MYFYKIGFNSHEESDYIYFYHKKKFTEKEFEELVLQVSAPICMKILKNKKEELKKDIEDARPKYSEKYISMMAENAEQLKWDEVYKETVQVLCKKHGFNKIETTADFVLFAWCDIMAEDGKGAFFKYRNPEMNSLRDAVKTLKGKEKK